MRFIASLGLVLGLLPTAVRAQDVRSEPSLPYGVHRMVIYNGTMRTVHYFPSGESPGEVQVWRDQEQAENEAAYVDNLQGLRRQYVEDERRMEAMRSDIQQRFYGFTFDKSYVTGVFSGSYAAPPLSYPWPNGTYYGPAAYGTATGSVVEGLGTGIGPEGVIKEAMANVIARQATPEYTATVDRQLGRAVGALPPEARRGTVPVAHEREVPGEHVTAVLKGGDKVEGRLVSEDAEWLVVRTANGEERVRMSEVVRLSTRHEGK